MSSKSHSSDSARAQPLVDALRVLHLRAGRPSARAVAAALGNVSHTTVAEALNGKRIPSWPIVQSIVNNLDGDESAVHALWVAAMESSTDDTEASPEGDDFLARYRRQVMAYHGRLAIPDPHGRRILGIGSLFVMPSITARGPAEMKAIDLESIFDESGHVVLLGGPGSGKSAVCSWLMNKQASDDAGPVPFHVALREFSGESAPTRSVVSFIEFQLETLLQCPAEEGYVSRCMREGRTVIVFDGLDEVFDTSLRATIVSAIESFCTEFPQARVLVASRTAGYYQTQLDPSIFATYHLEEFGDAQVERYVRQWFASMRPAGTAEEIHQLANTFLQHTATQADMRATPLLLAMMCAMHQEAGSTPRGFPELYEQSAKVMLERYLQLQPFGDPRARQLVEPLLRRIAFWMFSERSAQLIVSENQLAAQTAAYLSRRLEDGDDVDALTRELIEFFCERSSILQEVGTGAQGERLYSFALLTLLEYFAATHLVAVADSPEQLAGQLADKIDQAPWVSVGKLALLIVDRQIERGGERIVKTWLEELDTQRPDHQRAWHDILSQCPDLVYLPPSLTRAIDRLVNRQDRAAIETDLFPDVVNESHDVGYRGPAACQIVGITYRQLDYWAQTGLVAPSLTSTYGPGSTHLYSFRDLVIMKVVTRLLNTGVTLQNIRVAVDHLRDRSVRDMAAITLFSDGNKVYECTSPEEILDLVQGGHGLFGIAVAGAMQEIDSVAGEFPAERADGTVVSPPGPAAHHEQSPWHSSSNAG